MSLSTTARRLFRILREHDTRIVLAESCTGGLVAASLARLPGISDFLCGSAVTYRNDTKHQWLGIQDKTLEKPGPVSAVVAREMAHANLQRTPEADWSASITGHLGPNAPPRFDGVVYIGLSQKQTTKSGERRIRTRAARHQLVATTRAARQTEAAELVLASLCDAIGS